MNLNFPESKFDTNYIHLKKKEIAQSRNSKWLIFVTAENKQRCLINYATFIICVAFYNIK